MFVETKEMPLVEAKPHRYARLSKAILDGCKLRPRQCFEKFFDEPDGACALGAAMAVRGIGVLGGTLDMAVTLYPELSGELMDHIARRNDEGMSREEIAAWLLTL